MNIGERIKQRREELGLSVDDVAKMLGKHRATVYRYESDEIEKFPTNVLEPLAMVLQTTPSALMGWDDDVQQLLDHAVAEDQSGRSAAREAMLQTHGTDHTTHSLHVVGKKFALLYYHAFDDRRQCGAASSLMDSIEKATPEYADHLRLVIKGYDEADDRSRQMVDFALDPFIPEYLRDDGATLDMDVPVFLPKPKRAKKPTRKDGFEDLDVYDQPSAAGLGNYLDMPASQSTQFPSGYIPAGTSYGVTISGDSMEPRIHNESTAFVQESSAIYPGEIGIFVLNGQAYCKQLIVDHEKREVRLHSLNRAYDDIVIGEGDELRTLGRVLGSYPQ